MIFNWFYKKKSKSELFLVWFVIFSIFSLLIYFRYLFVISRSEVMTGRVDKVAVLKGDIISEPDDFGFKKSFIVEVDEIVIGGEKILINKNRSSFWLENVLNIKNYFVSDSRRNRVRVIVSCGDCKFGHAVNFRGTLTLPKITEDFNSNIFLLARGVQFEMVDAKIDKVSELDPVYGLQNFLYNFKNSFVEKIKLSLRNREEAALGSGILITGKGELSKKTLEDFKRAGLIHMVVLSGFNVSIVAQVIISILSFLPKIITGILGGIGIVLFSIMVGGGATVIRSMLMSLIGIYAKVFDKDESALKSVLLAGALMLVGNPLIVIGDPSFQLSFACTLGLILLGNSSKYFFSFITDKFSLREIISSSVATQIFALPLLLKFSGAISVYGILANIVVVPFIPFAMLAVFLMGITCFINPDVGMVFSLVSHLILSYILFIAKYVSSLESALLEVGKASNLFVICWYLTLLPISILLYKKFINNPHDYCGKKTSIKFDG